MALLPVVATALWAMLPAYVPNNAAVVAGGGHPIDGGRTWRGTAAGALAGTLLALALNAVRPAIATALGVDLPEFPLRVGVALAAGAMLGDVTASFLKRRTGRERGAAFPGLDQLDFVVGALALALVVAPAWTTTVFTIPVLVAVAVLTPLLHLGTNAVGYVLGLKREPW